MKAKLHILFGISLRASLQLLIALQGCMLITLAHASVTSRHMAS